jgi:hypothetical protein
MLPLLLDIYFIGETNRITKSLLVNAIVIKEAISISHLQRLSTKIVAGINNTTVHLQYWYKFSKFFLPTVYWEKGDGKLLKLPLDYNSGIVLINICYLKDEKPTESQNLYLLMPSSSKKQYLYLTFSDYQQKLWQESS